MNKIHFTFFLSAATAKEIGIITGKSNQIIEIIYLICLVFISVKYLSGSLPEWIWKKGLYYISISALFFMGLTVFGVPPRIPMILDSCFCLIIWIISLRFMINYKANETV